MVDSVLRSHQVAVQLLCIEFLISVRMRDIYKMNHSLWSPLESHPNYASVRRERRYVTSTCWLHSWTSRRTKYVLRYMAAFASSLAYVYLETAG
jgi:hypothetical protein